MPQDLPPLPPDVLPDVQRLAANDQSLRKSGTIGQAVVDDGVLKLRRALEKMGEVALRHGIRVALDRGKGLAFAAGCVRNYAPEHDQGPLLRLAPNPRESTKPFAITHTPKLEELK